jgi:chromate reductase, NAD(P)H dehydrogenase (quinone)
MADAPVKIVAFAGSLRTASLNRKLLALAVKHCEAAGATVNVLDLRALAIPLYDGDLEQASGLPEGVKVLRDSITAAAGVLVATPEYNHSIPGVLKNALDWVSRPPAGVLKDKVVAMIGASNGIAGTIRVNYALRPVFTVLGAWLVPGYVGVPNAATAFDDAGNLKEDLFRNGLEAHMKTFVTRTRAFSSVM